MKVRPGPPDKVKITDGSDVVDIESINSTNDNFDNKKALVTASLVLGRNSDNTVHGITAYNNYGDSINNTTHDLLGTQTFLHGYNGTTWDRLRLSTAPTTYTDTSLNSSKLLHTAALLHGTDGSANKYPVAMVRVPTDAETNASNPLDVYSRLAGFNGSTWDRVGISGATNRNLNVRLREASRGVSIWPISGDNIVTSTNALATRNFPHGFDGSNWDRLRCDTSDGGDINNSTIGCQVVINLNYVWDAANTKWVPMTQP